MRVRFVLPLLFLAPYGCDDPEEPMPLACRAQTYSYSQYTGARRGCTCHDQEFVEEESPQEVCQDLFDSLFNAGYSGSSSDRSYNFVTAAPGLTCEDIVVDPCDNTRY